MQGANSSRVPKPNRSNANNSQAETDSSRGLAVRNIDKRFGTVQAVKNISQDVHAGEFFTLLGPSGCGKTTLLRIIAGLELPDNGQVLLGDEDITSLPASKRLVNTVFQSYALFPHLSIFENVAFGLRSRKTPQSDRRTGKSVSDHGRRRTCCRFCRRVGGLRGTSTDRGRRRRRSRRSLDDGDDRLSGFDQ